MPLSCSDKIGLFWFLTLALPLTEGGVTLGRSCASVSLSVKSYNCSSPVGKLRCLVM